MATIDIRCCPSDGRADAMAITAASNAIDLPPSGTSSSGLDAINFPLAGMQAGSDYLVTDPGNEAFERGK